MRLALHEWGAGSRTVVLVHGYTDDHRTWWRVAPELARRGYRVVAPDLRGHGGSRHAAEYTAGAFADDLVDTLPVGVHAIVGHSLGAVALCLAADRLAPERAVYVDPPWRSTKLPSHPTLHLQAASRRAAVLTLAPHWLAEDVEAEVSSTAAMDRRLAGWIPDRLFAAGDGILPAAPGRPSLVLVPSSGAIAPPDVRARLAASGFVVREVAGCGHVMHRDNFAGFVAAVAGWLVTADPDAPEVARDRP